jgi:hypothetical protein
MVGSLLLSAVAAPLLGDAELEEPEAEGEEAAVDEAAEEEASFLGAADL